MDNRFTIRVTHSAWCFGFDLLIGKDIGFDGAQVVKPVEFVPYTKGQAASPAISLEHDTCQQLMDELWKVGVRPSNGEGSVGQIGAVKEHLADMRDIAFAKLKLDRK